ncbi:MAG: DUF512 domain-containing protein, partial [Clostridiales bacterium]|nr:DUF512 domain-containing protein [Clostridiales bacterium]
IPDEESYEGYPQMENGVGMLRSFMDEFDDYYDSLTGDHRKKHISLATGVLASPYISQMLNKLNEKFPNINVNIYTIENSFFGKNITVAGLLTGEDIINQVKDKELGSILHLPDVLLRHGEEVLLDDLTVSDIEKTLQTKISIVQSDGKSFIDAILND